MKAMKTRDFIFKYITSTWSLVIFIAIFGLIFSLAILLRLELMERHNFLLLNKYFDIEEQFDHINHEEYHSRLDDSVNSSSKESVYQIFEKFYNKQLDCLKELKEKRKDKSFCEEYCRVENCQGTIEKFCGDNTWLLFQGYCVRNFNEKSTWKNARTMCSSINSSLVQINDQISRNSLNSLIKRLDLKEGIYFIGSKKPYQTNGWFWKNHEKIKTWASSEKHLTQEKCSELIVSNDMRFFGKYDDYNCDLSQRKFLCEKKLKLDIDDYLYEYFEHQDYTEEHLEELLNDLEVLSRTKSFSRSKSQADNLFLIINKLANLRSINFEIYRKILKIFDNILQADWYFYEQNPIFPNTLLNGIEKLVKKISTLKLEEFKAVFDNFIVKIDDFPLIDRKNPSNFNYLPITQEFYKNYEIIEQNVANVNIKSRILLKNMKKISLDTTFFPSELDSLVTSVQTRISTIYYKNSKIFLNRKGLDSSDMLCNPIISLYMYSLTNMTRAFSRNLIEYQINLKLDESIDKKSLKCIGWKMNQGEGYWSGDGCRYLFYDPVREAHKCSCNQTNSVGLSYSYNKSFMKKNKVEFWISKTLTYIGLLFSSIGLSSTLTTYSILDKTKKSVEQTTVVILASTLLISNLMFVLLSLITPTINVNCCIAFGVLLHYFLLSSFLLMLVISMTQYLIIVNLFKNLIKNFLHKSRFLCFGIPILIPLVILCADPSLYINENQSICWLKGTTLYITFIGPMVSITCLNLGFFVSIIITLFHGDIQIKTANMSKSQIGVSFVSFILTSSTWLIGLHLLLEYDLKIYSEILFCILNTLQGLFLFIFHVYLSRPKKECWKKASKTKDRIEQYDTNSYLKDKFKPILKRDKINGKKFQETCPDSHFYEELTNIQTYIKPNKNVQVSFLNSNIGQSLFESGFPKNPLHMTCSKHFFTDDVALRIDKLNQSLKRIKALNHDFSIKNGAASLHVTELPNLFFD